MRATQSTKNAGFSLLELTIALAVFAVGLPAFIEAGAFAVRAQNRAEAAVLGADLGQTVLGRLSVLDANHTALVDTTANNAQCFTVGGSPSGCAADHGNTTAELTTILMDWGAAGANGSAYRIQMQDGFAAVWYEGYWFHVAWNVEDDKPYEAMKTINLYVVQKPFTGALGVASWGRVSRFKLVRMSTAL